MCAAPSFADDFDMMYSTGCASVQDPTWHRVMASVVDSMRKTPYLLRTTDSSWCGTLHDVGEQRTIQRTATSADPCGFCWPQWKCQQQAECRLRRMLLQLRNGIARAQLECFSEGWFLMIPVTHRHSAFSAMKAASATQPQLTAMSA